MSEIIWESQIALPRGVHCRVAAKMTEIVATHDTHVQLAAEGGTADCSSMLEILSLALTQGSSVRCTATGPNAPQVAQALDQLLSAKEEL
jgi:phosphocarrier protein HPr